ncbi:MAG: hypothetical protein H0U57_10585 [Tatlockia sp.]|nr:hypothetical protein [Tatlockia sp.]
MKQLIIIRMLFLLTLSSLSYADNPINNTPWTVDAAFGVASFSGISKQEGQTAVGRLSLGRGLFITPYWQAGLEAGIQSGNKMHLILPEESIELLGGVPFEAEIKPLLDVLMSFKTKPFPGTPVITWLKGGGAYRKLQVDRLSVNHLAGFSPEIQIGLGYQVNEQATINLSYQRIWGKEPKITVDAESKTGVLCNIPEQRTLMIGLSFNF